MTAIAALSRLRIAEILFAVVALVGLRGFWLLITSAVRRGQLVQRGGAEIHRRRRFHEVLDARLARSERGVGLAGKLRSAGTELTPARFLMLAVAASVGTFVVASLVFPALLAVVAAALAFWGCFAWLRMRLERRNEQFIAQLPEVARLLSNGASAGLSMPAAIELCVREIESPARDELQTVNDQLGLGRSLADSLLSLQKRLPSREVAVLMTTLIIQQRAGGDVVRALQDLSVTLDQRRETLREVRTLMAGAVYTSYLVPLLGVGALLLLNAINSSTLDRMTASPIGIAALVVAAALYVGGSLAIRRTTRIEV